MPGYYEAMQGVDEENERNRKLLKRYAETIDALHHRMLDGERKRGGKPCGHVTLRAPHLPCPHPDCYAMPPGGRFLRVMAPSNNARFYGFADDNELRPAHFDCETWERAEFSDGFGVSHWGWRRR